MRFRTALAALTVAGGLAAIPIAAQSPQRTFATPQEAAQALIDAAAANDSAAMMRIFGPEGKDIIHSGDAAADKENHERFVSLAREKLQVELDQDKDRATLIVGTDEWPMPVPIDLHAGQWRFNSAVGRVEVLARRVGRNELVAIEVCHAYVEAQNQYAEHDRSASGILQYAQKIPSSPGRKDGLYWEGEPDNLVPKAFADASAGMLAGGGKPAPYHGYYFRILKAQGPAAEGGAMDYVVHNQMIGGFALVAYPAEYGVSGIQTFTVNHRGQIYEKDLGPATGVLARQIVRFNPDKGWKPVIGE